MARRSRSAPTTSSSCSSLLDETPDPDTEADRRARGRRPAAGEFERERTLLLFSGEYDAKNAVADDQRRRGRHRGDRLGRHAAADVPPLGGAPPVQGGRGRLHRGRAGGHQERDRDGRRAVRLRLAAGRARRPPPRADQPLRRPEAAPDDLRAGRGHARGRRGRRDRAQLGRDPGRHVPLVGRRRPARPEDRVGDPADAPADRASSSPARTSGRRPRTASSRSGSSSRACSSSSSRSARRSCASCAASTSRPAGATRSGPTCCIPTRWSRTCGPGYETSNTGAVLDGDLDAFMQAELERVATGRAPSADARRGRLAVPPPGDRQRTGRAARPTSTPACGPGGPASRATRRGSTSRRCPTTSRRCGGSWCTCWPPTRTASGSPSGAAPATTRRRRSSASPAPRCARACGSSRCCSSIRPPRPTGSDRRSWTAPRPAATSIRAGRPSPRPTRRSTRASTPGACAPTPCSRSRTGCTPGAGWSRGSRSGGCSARSGAGRRVPTLPAGLIAVPFEAVEHDGPDGRRRLAELARRRSTASSSARPTRSTTATCGATAGSGSSPASRADGRSGYVYGSGIGRLGPVAAARSRAPSRRCIGTAIRETPALGRGRGLGPGHRRSEAMRALLDAGPPHRRLARGHLLVPGRPPVRSLPPDLARDRLTVCRSRHRMLASAETWPHRPCPWAETSSRPAPRAATPPVVRSRPRPLRHRADP